MKSKYETMEALDKALKIHKLEADIAEQTFLNHWQNLRKGVKEDSKIPQLAWQALRNVKLLGFARSHLMGAIAGTAVELVMRKYLFKRKR